MDIQNYKLQIQLITIFAILFNVLILLHSYFSKIGEEELLIAILNISVFIVNYFLYISNETQRVTLIISISLVATLINFILKDTITKGHTYCTYELIIIIVYTLVIVFLLRKHSILNKSSEPNCHDEIQQLRQELEIKKLKNKISKLNRKLKDK